MINGSGNGSGKKKIDRMLDAVRDLKQECYVGTGEAYKVIRGIADIYDNPEKVSIRMNHYLRQNDAANGYEATPERTIGLARVLAGISLECSLDEQDPNDSSLLGRVVGVDAVRQDNPYLINPKDTVINLGDYFLRANQNNVVLDSEFGNSAVEVAGERIRGVYGTDVANNPENAAWAISFPLGLRRTDWGAELSREAYEENLSEQVRITEGDISGIKIFNRLVNDRYDGRLEYRRALLSRFLVRGEHPSYSSAVSFIDQRLASANNRLKKTKGQTGIPNFFLKELELTVDYYEYLRKAVETDHAFVDKFLAS